MEFLYFLQMDDIDQLLYDIEHLQTKMKELHDSWKQSVYTEVVVRVFAMLVIWQWIKLQRYLMLMQMQKSLNVEGIDLLAIVYAGWLLQKLQI